MMECRKLLMIGIFTMLTFSSISVLWGEEHAKNSSKSLVVLSGSRQEALTPFPNDDRTHRILKQHQILEEGDNLAEKGLFEEAIGKYKEAMDPVLLNKEHDKSGPIWRMLRAHKFQGEYESALEDLRWFVKQTPNGTEWSDEKLELESFISERDKKTSRPIYDHIQYLKDKYKASLPPKAYNSFTSNVASDIIRLYDHIGDLDQGIAFVDQILSYKKLSEKARREYLKVKQAFLDDKAESTRGRATQVLIQSDYFPW